MNIRGIDLNLLVVLQTVLAERSVARAASRLHVTSSAISNSLARLRDLLGDPLLVKSGRGIVPTARALELEPVLSRALVDLERAVTGVAFDPAETTRRFTLAIADAGQIVQIPALARDFAAAFPRARLRVVGIDTYLSTGGVAGTEIDVLVGAVDAAAAGFHSVPLYEEHAVLVARRDHPVFRSAGSRAQLGGLRHVDVEVAPGRGYRDLASSYASLGIEREVALVVPSFTAAAAIVGATDHVATLPASLVQRHGSAFGVREVRGTAPRLTIAIRLVWHDRTHDDPLMRRFRERVTSVLRAERASPGGATAARPRARRRG